MSSPRSSPDNMFVSVTLPLSLLFCFGYLLVSCFAYLFILLKLQANYSAMDSGHLVQSPGRHAAGDLPGDWVDELLGFTLATCLI